MAASNRPVCVPCKTFFKPKKNGIFVEEGRPAGTGESGTWHPYKLFAADLYECRSCGAQIIHGIAREPISEHYMRDYAEQVRLHPPMLRIEDC